MEDPEDEIDEDAEEFLEDESEKRFNSGIDELERTKIDLKRIF